MNNTEVVWNITHDGKDFVLKGPDGEMMLEEFLVSRLTAYAFDHGATHVKQNFDLKIAEEKERKYWEAQACKRQNKKV